MAIEAHQHTCSVAVSGGEVDVLEQPSTLTNLTTYLCKECSQ